MTKILFLDIDGVLNNSKTPHRYDHPNHHLIHMDPHKVFMLNVAQDRAGFDVVLSSSWRHGKDWRGDMRANGLVFDFLDRTPTVALPRSEEPCTRGREITQWLDGCVDGPVERYAILDDENDMLPEQQPHFFKTDGWFGAGLTQDLMDRVVAHLA